MQTARDSQRNSTGSTNTSHYDVFISYRRESGAAEARLIRAELRVRNVRAFLDVDDLGFGHFDKELLKRIAETPHFIVVLSPNALDRCAEKGDWLRQEIAAAIRTGRNIVPVLLPGFIFPNRDSLPNELRDLVSRNGLEYSHRYLPAMMDDLKGYLLRTSAPAYSGKSGNFHRKRHIEVAKNRQRILIWIAGITLIGTGLTLITTYLVFGKPWREIIYPVLVFLIGCCLWASRFYRTWMLNWNEHEIVVINWWSLLGRAGEELWIDGQLQNKRSGALKTSGALSATIITPEHEHAVVAYLGSTLGGLRVGCQIVIDNELVYTTKGKFLS